MIELLITAAIVGILSAIIFGNFLRERPRTELKNTVQRLQADLRAMQTNAQGGVVTNGTKRFGYGVYFFPSYTVPSPPSPPNTYGYPTYADGFRLVSTDDFSEGFHEGTEPPDADLTKRPFPTNVRIEQLSDGAGTNYNRADVVYTVPNGRAVVNALTPAGSWQKPTTLRVTLKNSRINVCYSIEVTTPIGSVSTRQLRTCP